MSLTTEDQARVSAAIRAAEARTGAELVCVLAERAPSYATFPLAWAILPTLALPWLLVYVTDWTISHLLLAQLGCFALLLLVFSFPPIRLALVPRRLQRAQAHRAALEQFVVRGLARKPERTGVLVFVSLAERYVRIVADAGVAEKVPQRAWDEAVAAMTSAFREDRIAEGFIAGIERCADVLAAAVPPVEGEVNVLPDRIYLI